MFVENGGLSRWSPVVPKLKTLLAHLPSRAAAHTPAFFSFYIEFYILLFYTIITLHTIEPAQKLFPPPYGNAHNPHNMATSRALRWSLRSVSAQTPPCGICAGGGRGQAGGGSQIG